MSRPIEKLHLLQICLFLWLPLCGCSSGPNPAEVLGQPKIPDYQGIHQQSSSKTQLSYELNCFLECEENQVAIHVIVEAFQKGNHFFEIDNTLGTVAKIDGKLPIGLGGNYPEFQISRIILIWNGKEIPIDFDLYSDAYDPQIHIDCCMAEFLQGCESVEFSLKGGSGATFYTVDWVFNPNGEHSRETDYFDPEAW